MTVLLLAVLVVALAAACGSDGDMGGGAEVDELEAPASAAPSNGASPAGRMTAALRAAYIAAVQAGAGEPYRFTREPGGPATADCPAQRLRARIDGGALELEPAVAPGDVATRSPSWWTRLSWRGYRRGPRVAPVSRAGRPEVAQNRIAFVRGGAEQWYLNGPLGLEQGFALPEPPAAGAVGDGSELLLTIAVEGTLTAQADADGVVRLLDAEGITRLRYGELFVRDAADRPLPSRLAVAAGGIELHIDDAGARYPLAVDPLVWVEQDKLLASDGAASDGFGSAVSVSGDSAVVGAPSHDTVAGSDAGTAYVFVRSGGVWAEQQKLEASDGAAGDGFGYSVSIDLDTVVVGADADDNANGGNAGAAYVFVRSGGVWAEQQKLLASDGAQLDAFGCSVSLSIDTAVVGA